MMDIVYDEQKGVVCIPREIITDPTWEERPFSKGQAFIDLLLLANANDKRHIKSEWMITQERGSVNYSILKLSRRWGWDRKKTTRFLNALEDNGTIFRASNTQGTKVVMETYEEYQNQGGES